MAVLFAVLAVLIYIAGLMCSHLAAFRIATNLRIEHDGHIATLPLGAIEQFGSGKLRRTIVGDLRRGGDLSGPPAAGQGGGHGHHRGPAGVAAGASTGGWAC